MKAEPETRLVKGKDVKFNVDDFEAVRTTPWEGVRNAEARNIMKSMKTGDRVLFYHSNCKSPGIAAFAEVSREAYPDYTAWDPSHPYFDAKTDKDNPKWFMVDVTFQTRASHFVSLALLKRIAASSPTPPADVKYIGKDGASAITAMALINRGRLSVQPVEKIAYTVIQQLAETGGWGEGSTSTGTRQKVTKNAKATLGSSPAEAAITPEENRSDMDATGRKPKTDVDHKPAGKKRKATDESPPESAPLRRSTRSRK